MVLVLAAMLVACSGETGEVAGRPTSSAITPTPGPSVTMSAGPTATTMHPVATKFVQKGRISFLVPATWDYRDADGHDFSLVYLTSGLRGESFLQPSKVEALGLHGGAALFPSYGNERRETVSPSGLTGMVLKGLVQRRWSLDDYLGATAEVPLGARPNVDLHIAGMGNEEWRLVVELPGDAGRFQIAVAIEDDSDRRAFEALVRSFIWAR